MKKFACLALAAVIALGGILFGGCDSTPKEPSGGQTEPPKEEPQETPKPQDTVPSVDRDTRRQLIDKVLGAEIAHGVLDVAFQDVTYRDGEKAVRFKTLDTTVWFEQTEEGLIADLFGDGTEEDDFGVAFLRGGNLSFATGAWASSDAQKGDYETLLKSFAEEGGEPLASRVLYTEEQAAEVPFTLLKKLLLNVPDITGGMTVKGVVGGYELVYDPVQAVKTLLMGLSIVSGTVTPQTKLSEILSNLFMDRALEALFRGVKAYEVTSLPMFENYRSILTNSRELDFYPYLKDAVSSEGLYRELSSFGGAFPETVKCLGDLTVEQLVDVSGNAKDGDGQSLKGEELSAYTENFLSRLKDVFDTMMKDPIGGLLELLYARRGNLAFTGNAETEVHLTFDAAKNFTGMNAVVRKFSGVSDEVTLAGEAEIRLSFADGHTFADVSKMNVSAASR